MTRQFKTHFKHFMIGSLAAALGASAFAIAAVAFTDFTAGTTISSTEMNTKLNALKTAVNATPITVTAQSTFFGNTFNVATVSCPAGYYATGGGIDLGNVMTMYVTSSAPTYAGIRLLGSAPTSAPDGWQASAFNTTTTLYNFTIAVICMPS